jgi:hypothetical protein
MKEEKARREIAKTGTNSEKRMGECWQRKLQVYIHSPIEDWKSYFKYLLIPAPRLEVKPEAFT